jgi:two-component system, NarL family, sensor histidine kinase DesK
MIGVMPASSSVSTRDECHASAREPSHFWPARAHAIHTLVQLTNLSETEHVDRVPVTRLWTAYVIGWLLVLGIIASMILSVERPWLRLAAAIGCLTFLGCVFAWITLRGSLVANDLSPFGPGAGVLRGRLLRLAIMILTIVAVGLLAPELEAWWVVMHVVVAAGLALPPRLAAPGIAALIASSITWARLASGIFDPMLFILVVFGVSAVAMRQLTVAVAQLRAAREELAHAAVDRERLRFARDLHDLLGHTLSVITLKSELAGRLLATAPEQAAAEIADVERSARDAQRQVRSAVAGYRQPLLHRELAGARELLAAAGVEATIDDRAEHLSPEQNALLAWGVREGVTNVVRHARARRCEIVVRQDGDHAELVVSDDGGGPADRAPEPGHGLAGLVERALAQGARVEAGPRPDGGFRLSMYVPLEASGGTS